MQKQLLIYLILILFIALVFLGGFCFVSYQSQKETKKIEENSTPPLKTKLELKPEEYGRDELLDAQIIAINLDKNPKELDVSVGLFRFLNPPVLSLRRTILVTENTSIGIGRVDRIGIDEFIDITELRVGDRLLVFTVESTLEFLEREQYTAYRIKKLIIPSPETN